jgi:hypothetical protein
MVVFSHSVHPEYQSRPAHGWYIRSQKTAIRTTSAPKLLNIQGTLDLETFDFTFVDGDTINDWDVFGTICNQDFLGKTS